MGFYPDVKFSRPVGKLPAGTVAEIMDDDRPDDEVLVRLQDGRSVIADRADLEAAA